MKEDLTSVDLTSVVERFMPKIRELAKYVRRRYPKAEFEDLMQAGSEGLLKAMGRYDQYDPSKGELGTWVHKWILGAQLMHVRRETAIRRYEREAADAAGDARSRNARAAAFQDIAEMYSFEAYAKRTPEDEALTQEALATVDAWHSELPELEREVFRLRYAEDLKLDEIARAVGYSPSGLSRKETRMRAKLRRRQDRGG